MSKTMSTQDQFFNSDFTVKSLGNLWLVILTVKNVSVVPDVYEEAPAFEFMPTVSHPTIAWLHLLSGSLQVFVDIPKICPPLPYPSPG